MMHKGNTVVWLVCFLTSIFGFRVQESWSADWPQFRGPGRDGVSSETGLLDTWPKGGPPKRWQVDVGVGGGSCAIVDDRLYVMGALGDPAASGRKPPRRDSLICIDVSTGKQLWATAVGEYTKKNAYSSPHPTPVVVNGKVYGASQTGRLICCDAKSGKLVWQVDTPTLMGNADHSHYGYSCSPLVKDGRVFIFSRYGKNGLPDDLQKKLLSDAERTRLEKLDPDRRARFFWRVRTSVLAFDAASGELLWRSKPLTGSVRNDLASPIIGTFHEQEMLLWPTGSQLAALRPEDGEILWQFDYTQAFGLDGVGPSHSAVTPTIVRDLVIDQLWNHKPTNRTYCVRITEKGPKLVWQTSKLVSWYHSYIAVDGMLIGIDNQGLVKGAGGNLPGTRPPAIGMLQCYDIKTGELLWHTSAFGQDVPEKKLSSQRPGYIYADGKLIIQDRRTIALVAVDRNGAQVKGSFAAPGNDTAYGIPSLVNGRLFIRQSGGLLHCYDLRTDQTLGEKQ